MTENPSKVLFPVLTGFAAKSPPIRIGALPTVSTRIMPQAMMLFLKEETGARIKIVTGENAVLLEQLRIGDLDLVVGRLAAPEKMTGFSFEHLYSEKVVTFEDDARAYDQKDAEGFIKLNALRLRLLAKRDRG